MAYEIKNDDVYKSYANAVKHYLVNEYKVNPETAVEMIKAVNLENKFLNNPSLYEFVEPLSIAGKLYKSRRLRTLMGRKKSPVRLRVYNKRGEKRLGIREIDPDKMVRVKLKSSLSQNHKKMF